MLGAKTLIHDAKRLKSSHQIAVADAYLPSTPRPLSLNNLPVDILFLILEQLSASPSHHSPQSSRNDLLNLMLSCRSLYNLALPFYWKNVVLNAGTLKKWCHILTKTNSAIRLSEKLSMIKYLYIISLRDVPKETRHYQTLRNSHWAHENPQIASREVCRMEKELKVLAAKLPNVSRLAMLHTHSADIRFQYGRQDGYPNFNPHPHSHCHLLTSFMSILSPQLTHLSITSPFNLQRELIDPLDVFSSCLGPKLTHLKLTNVRISAKGIELLPDTLRELCLNNDEWASSELDILADACRTKLKIRKLEFRGSVARNDQVALTRFFTSLSQTLQSLTVTLYGMKEFDKAMLLSVAAGVPNMTQLESITVRIPDIRTIGCHFAPLRSILRLSQPSTLQRISLLIEMVDTDSPAFTIFEQSIDPRTESKKNTYDILIQTFLVPLEQCVMFPNMITTNVNWQMRLMGCYLVATQDGQRHTNASNGTGSVQTAVVKTKVVRSGRIPR